MVADQYVVNCSIVDPCRQRPLPPSEPVAAFAKLPGKYTARHSDFFSPQPPSDLHRLLT